jgi:carbohydrate-binding DOMON domain-containing protein
MAGVVEVSSDPSSIRGNSNMTAVAVMAIVIAINVAAAMATKVITVVATPTKGIAVTVATKVTVTHTKATKVAVTRTKVTVATKVAVTGTAEMAAIVAAQIADREVRIFNTYRPGATLSHQAFLF